MSIFKRIITGRVVKILPVSIFKGDKKKTFLLKETHLISNPIIVSALNGADITTELGA